MLQALAISRFHNLGEFVSNANHISGNKVDGFVDLENNPKMVDRHYTALSLQQHIQANDFVRQFEASSNFFLESEQLEHFHLKIEDAQLCQTLTSMTVDQSSFAAYFSSQLSCNERLLLSNGTPSQNVSNNIQNQGLPTPSQLQNVFDVLSTTVRQIN